MSIFKKAEKLFFTGKESESLAEIGEIKKGVTKLTYDAILGEKFNKKLLIIRQKASAPLGMSTNYFYLDKEAVEKLRKVCDDALGKL